MNDNFMFLDSNVVLYALASSCAKKHIALDLLCQDNVIISIQVINECSNILRRKFDFSYVRISETISRYLEMVETVSFDIHTIQKAWLIGDKYGFSYYDNLIISTALENNCGILYSEDMQHNQVIDGRMRILNPFFGLSV